MSDWWLVLDGNSTVQMKTQNEMEARTVALVKGFRAVSFPEGATVHRRVCTECRTPIHNGACPNMCHDQEAS